MSLASHGLAGRFFTTSTTWEALCYHKSWLKPTEHAYGEKALQHAAVCLNSRLQHARGLLPWAVSTGDSYAELASEESGGSGLPGLGEQALQLTGCACSLAFYQGKAF